MTNTAALLKALPKPGAIRFTPKRKAAILAAVDGGAISQADACVRYEITAAEFLSWATRHDLSGTKGLRVTRLQMYNDLMAAHGKRC